MLMCLQSSFMHPRLRGMMCNESLVPNGSGSGGHVGAGVICRDIIINHIDSDSDEDSEEAKRNRSNSLPIPKIEVTDSLTEEKEPEPAEPDIDERLLGDEMDG